LTTSSVTSAPLARNPPQSVGAICLNFEAVAPFAA